jgi:YD repeat-containing protein
LLQPKKTNILLGIIIGLTILCCASDDNSENNNPEKKLTQITYRYLDGQVRLTQNLVYDTNNNLIEINDTDGLITTSYSYNSTNLLIKKEDYEYRDIDKSVRFRITKNISYNSNHKISNIQELVNVYHSDGNLNYQNSSNIKVTYGHNTITSIKDLFGINKVEYTLSNNLITAIKISHNDIVLADMFFVYDDKGNCISGSGPYKPGLYDTNDIELSATYGNKEKNPFFNTFFDFNILYNNSFYYISETLINQQGTKYPEEMQWYKFEEADYKTTYNNSFDPNGYIISKKVNQFTTNPEIVTYTWN